MTATKEISGDAGMAAVLSEVDGVFTLKEEQRATLKAFLGGKDIFALLHTSFDRSSVKHHGTYRLSMEL